MSQNIPSYTKYKPERNYESFLNYVENYLLINETEDTKVGKKYIKEALPSITFETIFKNLEKYATDKLIALVLIAQEEGISKDDIYKIIIDCTKLEPTSGFGGENFAFATPIKTEVSTSLHKFKGKIDNKLYNDVYNEFKKILPEDVKEKVESKNFDVDNDILTLTIPQYYWAGYVDEEKFKDVLVKKLKMSEKELEKLTKVG